MFMFNKHLLNKWKNDGMESEEISRHSSVQSVSEEGPRKDPEKFGGCCVLLSSRGLTQGERGFYKQILTLSNACRTSMGS